MIDLNRRHLLAGAAAAGAAAALTPFGMPTARATVPPVGAQAPGFYRYKVGANECTSINDGARSFPMPDTFVKNVPKEEALAAAEAAYMPKGMVTVPFNPQLINTGSKLVLIDCGNGIAAYEPTKGAAGRTLQNLAAAGVDPKSIDIVLMSHLHPDHTNGIRALDGSMAFPNAEIMVPAKDWEFWMSDENAAKAQSNEMMKNYFANVKKIYAGIESKVTKYDWGKEVAPGITSIEAPGHTPGHTAFAVALRGRIRRFENSDSIRRHQHSRILPAQSGLARRLRRRSRRRTGHPSQVLRHGVGRKGDGGGFPLHLPLDRSCREGRHEIPADSDRLESGDLIAAVK
jgi:glyoxylase-like metal-dependent hydrolase (beta-lactamase superfamily II)